VLRDMSAIYGKAGGYEQVSVSFDAPQAQPGYFLNSEVLARVRPPRALRAIPDISYAVSSGPPPRHQRAVTVKTRSRRTGRWS